MLLYSKGLNMIAAETAELTSPVDALLVLSRNLNPDDTLSKTVQTRTEIAVHYAAHRLVNRVVVFSGGASWRHEMQNLQSRSGGEAMLDYTQELLEEYPPVDVDFLVEKDSISTVENMVNSKPLFDLSISDSLGIVSDELHFLYNRPLFIARKVFPGVIVEPIAFAETYTQGAQREELRNTLATKAALLGVEAGNDRAIMRRQRNLEKVNKLVMAGFAKLDRGRDYVNDFE